MFQGEVLSFAPSRSGTFQLFVDLVKDRFTVETAENYNELIWGLHSENLKKGAEEYDPNIHYPMLLRMVKK